VNDIRIISSIPISNSPEIEKEQIKKFTKLRDLFVDFRKEMKDNYNINCEFRVMQPELRSQTHDRCILSDGGVNFNIPSPDIIARGQSSNIRSTRKVPEFDSMWANSSDLLSDWDQIQQKMKSTTN
jgi:hypothetical protein